MGGRPITALNLVAWPIAELPVDLLARVLEGGAAVAAEAGVAIVGGHSIHDPEPKYGMAVTGFVEPGTVVRNSTMRPGDRLVLTKPLGLGIITTAVKRGEATARQLELAVETMTALNARAAEAMLEVGVSACTDVTGFGLLGHLHIALDASGASAVVDASTVPLLPGALELAEAGVVPSGTLENHRFVSGSTDWGALVKSEQLVLADAQTSGGLLISVPAARVDRLRTSLESRGVTAAEIGAVEAGDPGRLRITGRVGA
jgi:selenide, water dikinase